MIDLHGFAEAAAAPDGQPDRAFAALARIADDLIGARLFTALTFDAATNLARRSYSNRPNEYPVGGTKPVPTSDFAERVLTRGETLVLNDPAALAATFPDHALIARLGCASCINIPVRVAGRILGTLNALHDEGRYTADRVAASAALVPLGAVCFLMENRLVSEAPE